MWCPAEERGSPITVLYERARTWDELDAAETLARHQDGEAEPRPDIRRVLTAVHALRQIERAVVTGAANLGARDGVKVPSPTTS
jgi:hypothetical protein